LVPSSFKLLKESMGVDENIRPLEEAVLEYLWKSMAPSKVVEFSWLLLLECIPARTNLAMRNVARMMLLCVCCVAVVLRLQTIYFSIVR
jgi:hypothetical protein